MPSKLLTFQTCLPLCEQGNRTAWQFFLQNYTPIALRLVDFYLPAFSEEKHTALWQEMLAALTANNSERLRTFDHLSEREFLADLRAFLLDFGAARLDVSDNSQEVPAPALDSIAAILQGLPFTHQEIVFLKLAGHSDAAVEKIVMVPVPMARQALGNLAGQYGRILGCDGNSCPWPAAWLEFLRRARETRTAECVARRLLLRILDGQTTWYDKSPAEAHVARCMHCMESWIALREINFLRKDTAPLPSEQVELLLAGLPLAPPAQHGSFLRRWFGS